MKSLKLTKDGLDKLKQKLEVKREELRKLGIYKASAAANEGDAWHDNFAFEQTEIQERALIHTINDLQNEINNAEIIEDESESPSDEVRINSKVTVSLKGPFDEEEETFTFTLKGEFGPTGSGEVSINSPIGECIFGKKVGYEGSYTVNGNDFYVKVLNVSK